MYFYQRAGFRKTAETVGSDWADAASHMGPGQDPETRPWQATHWQSTSDPSQIKDLRGGWFDAGDYNKYTSWTARNVIALLRAYRENPTAFGDDTGIAELGNGVPDILDEVKWALDWLARMQNSDGSLLCVQGLDLASPPSAATGPSFYGPATTAASLMGAAAFAYAAKTYSARSEADLRAYGADLAIRAKRAWDWAAANPSVLYYNNDDSKQPGSRGLASGQQEMDDEQRLFAKFEAAVYLYELTNDAIYKGFVELHYTSIVASYGPTHGTRIGKKFYSTTRTFRNTSLTSQNSADPDQIRRKHEDECRSASNDTRQQRRVSLTDQRLYLGEQPIKDRTSETLPTSGFV